MEKHKKFFQFQNHNFSLPTTSMAFSSVPNFIHFPTPSSISSSNYLNRAAPPISVKRLRGSLRVKCHGDAAEPGNKEPLETNDILYKGIKNKKSNFLSNFIKAFQNSIIFMVKPTTVHGSMVGIKWKVGWNKTLLESKKGVSVHSHHSYVGNLLVGNLETIIEPLLQLGPKALLKNWKLTPTTQKRVASLCLGFFLLILSLFFFRFSVR